MNVAQLLVRAGRVFGERLALAVGTEPRGTHSDLALRVAILATAQRSRFALAPGDRVALLMKNCDEYVEVLFAGWHAGLTMVPVNAKLHPREFHYILKHSQSRLSFVTAVLAETVASLKPDLLALETVVCFDGADYAALFAGDAVPPAARTPDHIAWLFYTSGTTGRPKGAMLSHRKLLAMTLSYFVNVDAIAPDYCIIHPAPMSHGSGMLILPHVAAAAKQVIPASGGIEPAENFELIAAHRGVGFFAAPTMVNRLIASPAAATADTGNIETIVYGGGPMYAAD